MRQLGIMKFTCAIALSAALALPAAASTYYVTVAGLGGEEEFDTRFNGWASDLDKVLQTVPEAEVQTLKGSAATKEAIKNALSKIASEAKPGDAVVVNLIGHGTFDGSDYKINLPGRDMTAIELALLLDKVPAKKQLVVNMTSASGASFAALSKQGRVVITATKSGTERNATVFARFWVEAMRDSAADTDKNGSISALEAFRFAEQKTAKFYETQKRLATEHPLLDDTGKGEGVRSPSPENGQGLAASGFAVMKTESAAVITNDPEKRKLLARKEDIENQIDRLKYEKAAMPSTEYKKRLGALLIELAKTQRELDK